MALFVGRLPIIVIGAAITNVHAVTPRGNISYLVTQSGSRTELAAQGSVQVRRQPRVTMSHYMRQIFDRSTLNSGHLRQA